jgi:hypothetical protein
MDKEAIYDEKINPLMAEIIKICQEHKIAMVASFATPSDEDLDLFCSSRLPDETDEFPGHLAELSKVISRHINGTSSMMMMTVEHGDGTKTMTAIVGDGQ